jgi:hypothetical protein
MIASWLPPAPWPRLFPNDQFAKKGKPSSLDELGGAEGKNETHFDNDRMLNRIVAIPHKWFLRHGGVHIASVRIRR